MFFFSADFFEKFDFKGIECVDEFLVKYYWQMNDAKISEYTKSTFIDITVEPNKAYK